MILFKSDIPSKDSLQRMDSEQRLNLFRKFLAVSRHNRLILHHKLVKSTFDLHLRSNIETLIHIYIDTYYEFVDYIKRNGFEVELLDAIKEEELALEKIISTYERRMQSTTNTGFS